MKVNGIHVDEEYGPTPELSAVQELLRQRAVELAFVDDNADDEVVSEAIERVLQREVDVPEPTYEECRRWYDAHPEKFRNGDLIHARHILFQITPGAPVATVRSEAEALHSELRKNPEAFEQRARDKSNCPSGAQGGQLGQLQRGSTVPEFEKAVFDNWYKGVLPELVHTRHGFHIVAVDKRINGEQLPFEAVADQVADELRSATEERALNQYVRILASDAELEGVDLDTAESPLIQ